MKIQWTTRHTVVTVLAILTAALYALAATGTVHTDLVSNGKIEALCIGFGAGLFTPGSPLGLVLSKLFPPTGAPSVAPTLADLQAIAADAQTQGAALAVNLHIDTDAATTTPVERPVRVPPSRTSGGAAVDVLRDIVGVFAFATAAALLCHGCSPSALQVNATLASGAADMVNTSCPAVRQARDAEQHAAVDANATREAAAAAVEAVRSRWEPFVFGCNIAADAQNAWADFLVSSLASGVFSIAAMLPIASRFVLAYDDFLALHAPLPDGVTLPAIDPALVALIGGAQ